MYTAVSIALGLGLVILWIAGLAYHGMRWLTLLDGVAALGSVLVAAAFAVAPLAGTALSATVSLGLFLLWLIAIAAGGGSALAWWNFGFACAFMVVAAASVARESPGRRWRPA
jgi:hypothetical protein